MTLEFIGVGFGRTGTESLKNALEILGLGPCHHMYEVLSDSERYDHWLAVLEGRADPDWDMLLAGYRSSVDWPVAFYWRELATLFPDAKLILTVRKIDDWYASMEKTILKLMRDPDNNKMAKALADRVFGGAVEDRIDVIASYEAHNEAVSAHYGPERLLTYELGSGWAPLCRFLDCAVPEIPYPSANEAGNFLNRDEQLTASRIAQDEHS
ncbi:MAG: sulfotransferase [Flavimaricola sp.]|nr:sulfotransferase [Flavimaricola sp.]